jgi:TDG/mug DNA glycosylase family protein
MTKHNILPDILAPDLKIIFCGTAASTRSAERGAYYAGPGNRFWLALYEVGLTDRLLKPAEFETLLAYGIGLTDLVKHKAGMDKVLEANDFNKGRQRLQLAILEYRPRILCFTGKKAAKQFFGVQRVKYGLQEGTIGETLIFVAPSTSGAARRWWDISHWQKLAGLVGAAAKTFTFDGID